MPLQEEYQVRLDAFCGPLDLLLYLIRRAEVDIQDIPIAEITDQYMQFLQAVSDIDFEEAGEFLVMAATLMEIKSRTLMLPEAQEGAAADEDGEAKPAAGVEIAPGELADPRFELVQQLLEYQRYRMASEDLQRRRLEFSRQCPLRPARPDGQETEAGPPVLELEDAHVYDLYEAYERIVSAIDFTHMGDHRVQIDDTPAAVYQQELLDTLTTAGGRIALQQAFEGRDRVRRIGLFLAMLELVRLRRVHVLQEDLLSDIVVELE